MKVYTGWVKPDYDNLGGLKPDLRIEDASEEDFKLYTNLYTNKKDAIKAIKKRMQRNINNDLKIHKIMKKYMKDLK